MKSLNKIMKISKVLKILYTVCYILCIVGAACCILSGLLFLAMDGSGLWEDPDFVNMIGEFDDLTAAGIDFSSLHMVMFAASIACIGMVVVYIFAARFYKYVLTVRDPFNRVVICKMQTLGILYIVVPIASSFISEMIASSFSSFHLEVSNTPQVTMGIVYLILTVVFSFAADVRAEQKNAPASEEVQEPTIPSDLE